MRRGSRAASRRLTGVAVATTVTAALVTSLSHAPARAAVPVLSPATPQQQAAVLAQQVSALTSQEQQATQAYDLAQGQLGEVTTLRLLAERRAAADQAALGATANGQLAGLRALYESGGPLGIYSALLGAGSLTAISEAEIAVANVESGEGLVSGQQGRAAQAADQASLQLSALTRRATALAVKAARAAERIRTDLARQQQLLAGADATVAAQAVADQQAAAVTDAAHFLAALAAARGGQVGNDPAPTSLQAAAITAIQTKLGTPYQWGGTGPAGYDCSGLVGYAFAAAGVRMPRTAAQQYLAGTHPTLAALAPGDLLFWATDPADPNTIDHVALYAGSGMMYSDDHAGDVARLQPVWWNGFAGITEVVPAMAAAVPGPQWATGP